MTPFITFVVGSKDKPLVLPFFFVQKEGFTNVVTDRPIPPLNVTGLRRLARTIEAIADLLEHGNVDRALPEPPPEAP